GLKPTPSEQQKMKWRFTSSPVTLEWISRAVLFADENNPYSEIAPCLRTALEADTNCAKTYQCWGALLANQGKFEEAEKAFRESITLKPDDADSHRSLAQLMGSQQRYGEADDELVEAARLDPDDPETFNLMGEVYRMREQYLLAAG